MSKKDILVTLIYSSLLNVLPIGRRFGNLAKIAILYILYYINISFITHLQGHMLCLVYRVSKRKALMHLMRRNLLRLSSKL